MKIKCTARWFPLHVRHIRCVSCSPQRPSRCHARIRSALKHQQWRRIPLHVQHVKLDAELWLKQKLWQVDVQRRQVLSIDDGWEWVADAGGVTRTQSRSNGGRKMRQAKANNIWDRTNQQFSSSLSTKHNVIMFSTSTSETYWKFNQEFTKSVSGLEYVGHVVHL